MFLISKKLSKHRLDAKKYYIYKLKGVDLSSPKKPNKQINL